MPDDKPALRSSASSTEIAIGAKDLDSLDRGEERRRRVERLRAAQDSASVSDLIGSLSDSDWRVRRSAAAALALDASEDRSELLADLLYSDDAGERNAAIKALIKSGSDSVRVLVRELGSAEADVRNFAALALGQIGDPTVLGDLGSALEREDDENVRLMLIEALGRIGHLGAVPVLQEILAGETMESAAAAEALGSLGLPEMIGPLISALRDDPVGAAVAEALGRIGDVRSLLPLVRSCGGASPGYLIRAIQAIADTIERTDETTGHIARALGDIVCDDVPPELSAALLSQLEQDGPGRPAAMRVASWLGPAEIAPHVFRAAQDTESIDLAALFVAERIDSVRVHFDAAERSAYPPVRSVLARALAVDPSEAPRLLRLAHDANACVRVDAIEALGSLNMQAHAAPLVDLLRDPLGEIREAAIESLSLLELSEVAPGLVEITEEGDEEVRVAVARLVSKCRGHDDEQLTQLALTLARDVRPAVRAASLPAMGSTPGDEAVSVLVDLALDTDRTVRMAALRALAGRHEGAARSALREAVQSDDAPAIVVAVRALAEGATEGDVRAIVGLLDHAVIGVKVTAITALALCGTMEEAPEVVALTVHAAPDIRETALRALHVLDPSAACDIAALVLCGSEESWQVRLAAAEALGECDSSEAIPAVERALGDEEPLVRRAAVAAIPGAFGEDAPRLLLSMWDDNELCDQVIASLVDIGEGAVGSIVVFMAGASQQARGFACSALGRISSTASIGCLTDTLTSGSPEERWYALLGLHRSRAEWVVPELVGLIPSEVDETLRAALAAVCDRLGSADGGGS